MPEVNRLGIQAVLELLHLAPMVFFQRHEIQLQAAESGLSGVFAPCHTGFANGFGEHRRRQPLLTAGQATTIDYCNLNTPADFRTCRDHRHERAEAGRQLPTYLPSCRGIAVWQCSTGADHLTPRSRTYLVIGQQPDYTLIGAYSDQFDLMVRLAAGPRTSADSRVLWLQLTRSNRKPTGVGSMKKPPGAETSSISTIAVLSVSPSNADHAALRKILQEPTPNIDTNCRWVLYSASTVSLTLKALWEREIPIVISEDNLLAGTWRTILQCISLLPDPPLLIVASRLADERLWAEALNLGAWDVLAKPLDTQEVIRVVASAWRHWQEHRELRTKQKNAALGT
jgi:hypothetical protein